MDTIHIPDYEWRKNERKKRFNNKKRDRKKPKVNNNSYFEYDENEYEEEIDEIKENNFCKRR